MVRIDDGRIERGYLPGRAARLVNEWVELHRAELEDNWTRAHSERPLLRIAPL